jgi:micrococcal nuclease
MRPIFQTLAGLALCLAALQEPAAETFAGQVVTIFDGDTVEVLVDQRPRRVRLEGIDAPEKAQAFGARAKQRLADLVGGQVVTVESEKTDKYGRTVGKLTLNGQDVNLAMIADGLAWWYRKYASEQPQVDRMLYEAAEARAKAERRGLWRDPDPMPPWEWRHRPPPPGGYAAACPCDSSAVCTGPKGGRFCVRENGSKRYVKAE